MSLADGDIGAVIGGRFYKRRGDRVDRQYQQSSGLVNKRGRLVGINLATIYRGTAYAATLEDILHVLPHLRVGQPGPTRAAANAATIQSGRFAMCTATRAPFTTPAPTSPRASAFTRSPSAAFRPASHCCGYSSDTASIP